MNEWLTWVLDTVQGVDPTVRTLVAAVAIMLETSVLVGLIVPGDTIVIVAATAVTSPVEGIVLAVAVVIGALVGESIGYLLGYWLGPKIRASRLGQRIGEENWRRSERYFRRRGGPAIFISRFLPVLHSIVPLTVGMAGYPYRRFLAWTIPACIVWSALYITVASAAAGGYRELADQLHYAGYIFVAIMIGFFLLVFGAKKIIHRLEKRHFDEEGAHGSVVAPEDDVKD